MELNIINKKENPLLNRAEVSGEIVFQGATPTNDQVQKAVADKMKVDPSVVKIKNIYNNFGETKAKVIAHVYKSKEDFDKCEPKKKVAQAAKPEETKA